MQATEATEFSLSEEDVPDVNKPRKKQRVGKAHDKTFRRMVFDKSDDESDYKEVTNADDEDEDEEMDNSSNPDDTVEPKPWQELFPTLQEWTPESDKLARTRKTKNSLSNVTSTPKAGKKNSASKDNLKLPASERVLQFPNH
jgi:superfamily I DNA and RNA helicase